MQMGLVFILKMFQDKCNHDCNHEYYTFNVIVIDYNLILFICNCNRSDGNYNYVCDVIAPCLLATRLLKILIAT